MNLTLLRVCVLATCTSKALSRCAAGWAFAGDSCFQLFVGPLELLEPQASSACEAVGAVLAQPRNQEQERMILALIRQSYSHIGPERPGQVWVGGWSTPPECEWSTQPRVLQVHRLDGHGECVDQAGSSASASLCEKPAADYHFRRQSFDFDVGSGHAAELLQLGIYCFCVFLALLLLVLRLADLRGCAVKVVNSLAQQFRLSHESRDTDAYVQKELTQRRVLLVQLAALGVSITRMVSQTSDCSDGFDYIALCELATSYFVLASCRWKGCCGPWCLRLFPLFMYAFRRILLMLCLGPVKSVTLNTIYGIGLIALYPFLGIEGQNTFYSQTWFYEASCSHVVQLRELDSLSSTITEWAKSNPEDSPAALYQLLETLNTIRSSQSSLGFYLQSQVSRTFISNIGFLIIHMVISHDLRQAARTQSLEKLAGATTALMEQFCDASAQLSHDFSIVRPARRLASLLNVADSNMALVGSNFIERIQCELQRRAFISHLVAGKSSVNGLPSAFSLSLKDAFGLEVPVSIICHCYESLGTAHYLIGVTEMQERQTRQDDAPDPCVAPLFFASQERESSSVSSCSDCEGEKPSVDVDYIDSELRMQSANTEFELFIGSISIPRGTPLHEFFPDKSQWRQLEQKLEASREFAESNQAENIGWLPRPLEVKLSAAAGGQPRQKRFAKVQFTVRPALSPDREQQSQLTLYFVPCREGQKSIRRKHPRGVTPRSAGSDGSEHERLSPSADESAFGGVRRSSISKSDEVGAELRAVTLGSKTEL